LPNMREKKVAVPQKVSSSVLLGSLFQSRTNGPVRGVNGSAAKAIAMFLQKGTHAIALLDCVPFFEERIAKQFGEVAIALNQWLVLQGVRLESSKRDLIASVEKEMRVGVISD